MIAICKKKYLCYRNFTIKQHYIGNVRWYTCLYCPKEFKKPSDLIRHLRVHTQEKPFKVKYIFYSLQLFFFFFIYFYQICMRIDEVCRSAFQCMYCVRSFALKSTMIAHERTHSGLKKYACNSCNKSFACHNTLTAHMRQVSTLHLHFLSNNSFFYIFL